MSQKPALMIHEITEHLFQLPLEQYTLTFDDGLFSQYYHFPRFASIDTDKIFFISTGIICTGTQSHSFPTSIEAHNKARNGIFEDFMTTDQVKYLSEQPRVHIGGHSHNHTRASIIPSLLARIKHLRSDTEQMIEWFKVNLGYTPTKFCFPYNDDCNGIYRAVLRTYQIEQHYGAERISP